MVRVENVGKKDFTEFVVFVVCAPVMGGVEQLDSVEYIGFDHP